MLHALSLDLTTVALPSNQDTYVLKVFSTPFRAQDITLLALPNSEDEQVRIYRIPSSGFSLGFTCLLSPALHVRLIDLISSISGERLVL